MKYYKIVINKSFIGAVYSGQFVVEDAETHKLFYANELSGQFINYEGALYRDYWMTPTLSNTNKTFQIATITEITEEEYNIYQQAIEKNEVIEEEEEEEVIPAPTPIVIEPDISLEFIRASKITEMSRACRNTIENGFDLEIRGETQHFSLDTQDQLNLLMLKEMAQTSNEIPYHADGEICIFYTSEEILSICHAADEFRMYQTTYYNSLKNYINALEDMEDIAAVKYGMDIPAEYKSYVLTTFE